MSKAEERAWEWAFKNKLDPYSMGQAYAEGYHQAEKDMKLTWEDMRELHIIFAEIDVDIKLCKTNIKTETLGYYQEVLKRFKAKKGE